MRQIFYLPFAGRFSFNWQLGRPEKAKAIEYIEQTGRCQFFSEAEHCLWACVL